MNRTTLITCLLLATGGTAFAQATPATSAQRDVNQAQRIEQGLKSGELTTREAAQLQHQEAHIDRMQANALKDGTVTAGEKAKLNAAQNKASRNIHAQKHDAQTGNPNSASSKRMQADVQRSINQEKRIQSGMQSGELTNREAARLERGQARATHAQAVAGRDGHVGATEQAGVRHVQNHQSRRIYRQKHDAQTKH
ncbi:MAG: hypothetical protein HS128_14145 [Ideonella sp.]|nr:hypothetical protein [Ideonella sp.]